MNSDISDGDNQSGYDSDWGGGTSEATSSPDNSSGSEASSEVSSDISDGGNQSGYDSDWGGDTSEATSSEAASSDSASSEAASSGVTSSDTATSNVTSSEAENSSMPDVYCPDCGFVPENQLDAPKHCEKCGGEYIDNVWSSGWY